MRWMSCRCARPSRVLRIWIAPWEDEAGRLHVPGFTYAEIEPRRWSIGEDQPGRGMRLKPLPAPRRAPRHAAGAA